jgi:hypothetical protein
MDFLLPGSVTSLAEGARLLQIAWMIIDWPVGVKPIGT